MLFGNRVDKYPYLVSYLHETERVDLFRELRAQESLTTGLGLIAAFGTWAVVSGFGRSAAFLSFAPLLVAGLVVAGMANYRRRAKMRTPEFESRLEALQLLAVIRRMHQLNRLHRDLSESTLTLLDEVARLRSQVRDALSLPYWNQSGLSPTMVELKKQALNAVDQAAIDAVLQFRNSLPTQVSMRPWWSYLDEALETVTGKASTATPFTEQGFDGAFKVAQKMQTLKSEIEQLTLGSAKGIAGEVEQLPGALIDDALMEIRTIRQAEEELRQGI